MKIWLIYAFTYHKYNFSKVLWVWVFGWLFSFLYQLFYVVCTVVFVIIGHHSSRTVNNNQNSISIIDAKIIINLSIANILQANAIINAEDLKWVFLDIRENNCIKNVSICNEPCVTCFSSYNFIDRFSICLEQLYKCGVGIA